jgi:hypothetical protein
MMSDMGQHPVRRMGRAQRPGSALGPRAGPVHLAALAASLVLTGCSAGAGSDGSDTPDPESAALRVLAVTGADALDAASRAELEREVGDVLTQYVAAAFLGDFPREEFVEAFEPFTGRAAQDAAGDIRVLTAISAQDAVDVRATGLDARLSFLTRGRTVHGGTATVRFTFEATMVGGSTRDLSFEGRLLLDAENDAWSVFGYDVTLDNGVSEQAQTESTP